MAIPPWAAEVLRRGVGGVLDKVPADTVEQLRKRATDLLAELPQTAARGVDSVMRGSVMRSAMLGKESIHRWTRRHISLVTPVVNGSGCLCHSQIANVPMCPDAIELVAEALHSGTLNNAASHARLAKRLSQCVGSGDFGILITSSVDGACLAVGNALGDSSLYFHRSQSQRLPSGTPIPDAFAIGASLRRPGSVHGAGSVHEVGSIDRVDAADSRQINAPAVLVSVDNGSINSDWYHATDSSTKAADLVRVLYLPVAALQNDSPVQLPSIMQQLQAGIHVIVTPGNGTLGGPACGLIIGHKKQLDAIARSSAWPSLVADLATQAAMTVTLEMLASHRTSEVPVQAMMQTSEENLRSRAERLATRFAAEPLVKSCEITDQPAKISPAGHWSLPSRQLKLTHRDLSAADWAIKLLGEVPAMIVSVEEPSILVDLRWIQPSDDVSLVATLVGQPFVPESDQHE
jgi:L-seryl-tRNA(Ser) seleniumtransferase